MKAAWDFGHLVFARETQVQYLEYLLDTRLEDDVDVVECAATLGVLDGELLRRDDIAQAVCDAAREGRTVI